MKKVAFILAGLLAMMLAGCGEGSSSAGGSVVDTTTGIQIESTVSEAEADLTTPETPLDKLSMGAPPGLPK